jgi:hypothetical protein
MDNNYSLMEDGCKVAVNPVSGGGGQGDTASALSDAKQHAQHADAAAGVGQLSEAEFQRLCEEEAAAYAQEREVALDPHREFYTIDSEDDRQRVLSTYVQRNHPLLRVCFGSVKPIGMGPGGSLAVSGSALSCIRTFAEQFLSALPRMGILFVHIFCGLFIVLYASTLFACSSGSTVVLGVSWRLRNASQRPVFLP